MIKGCRKNMIFVKCGEESCFESAYFIMKNGVSDKEPSDGDLLAEAEKIINNSLLKSEKDKRSKKQRGGNKKFRVFIPFAAGATVGSAAGLIWLFI